jgi:hypothetical protein
MSCPNDLLGNGEFERVLLGRSICLALARPTIHDVATVVLESSVDQRYVKHHSGRKGLQPRP